MGLLLTTGCANKTATESPGDATPPGQPPAPGVGAERPSAIDLFKHRYGLT